MTTARIGARKTRGKYGRSRRGPVIENQTEHGARRQKLRNNGVRRDHNGFEANTTRDGLRKSRCVAIEMLPFGLAGSVVQGLYGMNL